MWIDLKHFFNLSGLLQILLGGGGGGEETKNQENAWDKSERCAHVNNRAGK